MSDFRAQHRPGNAADRYPPSIASALSHFALPAATLVAVLMAVSLAGLADDDRDDWETREDPLSEDRYSDPWATEYENPFSDPGPDADNEDRPDRFRVYDRRNRRTGRAERDPIGEDRYTLYEDRGRRTGRVEENPILDDSYSVYDRKGRRVKEIRRSPFLDGHYDIYDESGRRIGRIAESPIVEGQYDIYDEKGRRIGRVEGD